MKKYKIELTEYQLYLLKDAVENQFRNIIGQLDIGIKDICYEAIKRHYPELSTYYDRIELNEKAKDLINQLHCLCWNQTPNASYGVKYSEESDTLIDMNEVIRHFLYKERGDTAMTVDGDKPFHWNKDVELIKIEKI